MSRPVLRIRGLVAALALVLSAGLAAVASPSSAADAPVITLSTTPGPERPLTLPTYYADDPPLPPGSCAGEDCDDDSNVHLDIATTATVHGVTVQVLDHDGVFLDAGDTRQPGTVQSAYGSYYAWTASAMTPGFHTMTIEVTADDAAPVQTTLHYLWGPGGAALAGSEDLAGRTFGVGGSSYYNYGESDYSYRYSSRYGFGTTQVGTALPRDGHAACAGSAASACEPYEHDATSGLVQIGTSTMAELTPRGLYVSHALQPAQTLLPLAAPASGSRPAGSWHYDASVDDDNGIGRERLTLTKKGRFTLSYRYFRLFDGSAGTDYPPTVNSTGTYRIGRHGDLVLTSGSGRRRRVVHASLFWRTKPGTSHRTGIWLDVTVHPRDDKAYVDGNPMSPVER